MSENKNISQDVVAHMAQLSRLAVSDEEKALFARQFGDILAYMDVLAQVDTSAVADFEASGSPDENFE